jgi:capsular exopolysaccharide synthesis family protein
MHKADATIRKPHVPDSTGGLADSPLSPRAMEEYDQLRQSIIALTPTVERKVLLFVSATGGEGTSHTVAGFGVLLASAGGRPLLVDANLRSPVLHEALGTDKAPGTADLLCGQKTLEQVIKPTGFSNLLLVPAGDPPENPGSLLTDAKVESAFRQMRTETDWVLVDTPAVTAFNDAVALSSGVDGVILVVRAEKTRWEVVQNARRRLETGKSRILGVVLNDRKLHIPGWIYKRL